VSQPRNVTPGYEDKDEFPPGTFPNSGPGVRQSGIPPEWAGWSWAQNRDRTFPWLGLLLLLVGGGLLLEYFVPALSATTLVLGGIAIAFLAGWLFTRAYFPLYMGLLIGALVVARLIDELGIYHGAGTTALAVAGAFLLIWLIGASRRDPRHRPATWPLWLAGIFGLIGAVDIAGQLGRAPELGALWPLIIIGIGAILVFGGRRGSPRHC